MDEVKRLIEARQIEATKKQLSSKLMCILRTLGQKIEGGFASSIYDPDAWLTPEERNGTAEIQDSPGDDDGNGDYGYYFDGLSWGQNYEITYFNIEKQLRVSYNGYTVYKETEGVLSAYVPNQKWEELTESLYKRARPKEEQRMAEQKEKDHQSFLKQAAKFIQELRDSWGF